MASNRPRPRNRPNRASAKPAAVPTMVARVADTAAMRSDSSAASIRTGLCHSATYQRVEKPAQDVTNRESLKLSAIRKTIGAYRKA